MFHNTYCPDPKMEPDWVNAEPLSEEFEQSLNDVHKAHIAHLSALTVVVGAVAPAGRT